MDDMLAIKVLDESITFLFNSEILEKTNRSTNI